MRNSIQVCSWRIFQKETRRLPTSTPYSFRCKLLVLNGEEKTWHSANRKNTPAVDDDFLDGLFISYTPKFNIDPEK